VPRKHLDWKPDQNEIDELLEDALSDVDDDDDDDGAKWVKTDSDCKFILQYQTGDVIVH
jgi:hypothetical protein